MGYLHPPPGDGAVIVMKDVGGDVRQYAAQTYAYIRSGREVRLHECRSACTLALAAPNVCVYPDGVLRFHKAYNPITKATNDAVSGAMMMAYPPAVRERLGALTRRYKSLTGSELIRLGVRDCTAPVEPKIVVARTSARPIGAQASLSQASLSNGFGGLFASLGAPDIPAYSGYGAPVQVQGVKVQRVKVQLAETASAGGSTVAAAQDAPEAAPATPPPRPEDLTVARQSAADTPATPAPPQRPAALAAPPTKTPTKTPAWGLRIHGSAPTLASARFAPFPYRLIRKS
ncbi:hypothetical protein [Rhodoblastus sp.]|uniref:hypothetical protein n=1 Tax=Rhodoblastus sp. TaxID=1962975 RepID=UPI003F96DAB6